MNALISYTLQNKTFEPTDVLDLMWELTREDFITFLCWNDSEGLYTDEALIKEDMPPLTHAQASMMVMKIFWENSDIA